MICKNCNKELIKKDLYNNSHINKNNECRIFYLNKIFKSYKIQNEYYLIKFLIENNKMKKLLKYKKYFSIDILINFFCTYYKINNIIILDLIINNKYFKQIIFNNRYKILMSIISKNNHFIYFIYYLFELDNTLINIPNLINLLHQNYKKNYKIILLLYSLNNKIFDNSIYKNKFIDFLKINNY